MSLKVTNYLYSYLCKELLQRMPITLCQKTKKMNEKKAKVMVIGKKPDSNLRIKVINNQLEQLEAYKYFTTNILDNEK